MILFFKKLLKSIGNIINRIKLILMFEFKLKPKIIQLKKFVNKIIHLRQEVFPFGKSLFVFDGKEDTLYFIIYKESSLISVMEIYDEILNRIPERYQILPRINFKDLMVPA